MPVLLRDDGKSGEGGEGLLYSAHSRAGLEISASNDDANGVGVRERGDLGVDSVSTFVEVVDSLGFWNLPATFCC